MILKKDNLRLGLVLGFIAPIVGFLLYYLLKFNMISFAEFFQLLLKYNSLLSGIVSISLIANAVVFTYYINTRRDRTAKGIFMSTCFYAILALLYKALG